MSRSRAGYPSPEMLVFRTGPQASVPSASGTSLLSPDPHYTRWNMGDNNESNLRSPSPTARPPYAPIERPQERDNAPTQSRPLFASEYVFDHSHSRTHDSGHVDGDDTSPHSEERSIGPDRGISQRRSARQELAGSSIVGYNTRYNFHYPSRSTPPPSSPGAVIRSMPGQPDTPELTPDDPESYTAPSQYQLISFPQSLPSHSRSTSDSASGSAPRSTSPAPSDSAATSESSRQSVPPSLVPMVIKAPIHVRKKNKKQRLFDVDRKRICEYAVDNPQLKQEEIAQRFGVERSTVSKILKGKKFWLHATAENVRGTKNRGVKFPWLEMKMTEWARECAFKNTLITDASIHEQGLRFAKTQGWPEGKFKASAGWVENFKSRNGIKKGIWRGSKFGGRSVILDDTYRVVARTSPLPEPTPEELQMMAAVSNHPPAPMQQVEESDHTRLQVRRHPVWQSPDQSGVATSHYMPPATEMHPAHGLSQYPAVATDHHTADALVSPEASHGSNYVGHEHEGGQPMPYMNVVAPRYRPNVPPDPTDDDIENAIDTVKAYFDDSSRRELLSDPEYNVLLRIKKIIFCTVGGLPLPD
ncbi:hypothetical protein BDW22DRAFT_1432143 [Trametopsis cervina]|nr:hypothetical protein BDW22DRAFT_1432143 [Trametopsis cervina]